MPKVWALTSLRGRKGMRSGWKRQPRRCNSGAIGAAGLLLSVVGTTFAQTPPSPSPLPPGLIPVTEKAPAVKPDKNLPADNSVQQAGCKSCGGGSLIGGSSVGFGDLGGCGCGVGCVPGRKPCSPCEGTTIVGRFLCGLYECICCPDPCYDPHWLAVADAAFFTDAP